MKNIIVLAAGKAERMGDSYPRSKLFLSKGAVPVISNIIATIVQNNEQLLQNGN